jgi:phage FluMu protein Com
MIKFRCTQCNQKLGVPDEGAGKRARCPACGTVNAIPSPAAADLCQSGTVEPRPNEVLPSEPPDESGHHAQTIGAAANSVTPATPPPVQEAQAQLAVSPAHLLLLSEFRKGNFPAKFQNLDYWEAALGEKPSDAIERFMKDGALEPATLSEVMNKKFMVSDLKSMLKAKRLRVAGRKDELIRRLIENDEKAMTAATSDVDLYRCTPTAMNIVEDYLASEKAKWEAVEKEVLEALACGDFPAVVRAAAEFDAAQVFSHGAGMAGHGRDAAAQLESLTSIFSSTPGILQGVNEERLRPLRIAAAMMFLWGTHDARAWLPKGLNTGIRLDTDSACRMFVFYIGHLRGLKSCREAGVKKVQILGVGDDMSCPACRKLDGKRFRLEEVPELPYPKCTCEIGCRCSTVAEFD